MGLMRTWLLLLGALAVLALGAAPAVAEAPPPCHGTSHEAPATPDKPVKAMSCCAACVAAPLPQPPIRVSVRAPAPASAVGPQTLPVGRTPAPEPGPPRAVAA